MELFASHLEFQGELVGYQDTGFACNFIRTSNGVLGIDCTKKENGSF